MVAKMEKDNFLSSVNSETDKNLESFKGESFQHIKPNYKKYYILAGIVVVILLSVYFFLNKKVTVPNMISWSYSDATAWGENNKIQLIVTDEYSDQIAAEFIINQDILEGEKLKSGKSINIIVSNGFDPNEIIELPKFDSTWTKTMIQNWLNENGIENYNFENTETNESDPNMYILHKISGVEFKRSDDIAFECTKEIELAKVTIPTFTNQPQSDIRTWAATNNINIIFNEIFDENVYRGMAVTQNVESGEEIDEGSSINIGISKGPQVIIPNFSRYNEQQATDWATDNSMMITINRVYNKNVNATALIQQGINSGSGVEEGTRITLIYSLGKQVRVNNFANQTLLDLREWVNSQNAVGTNLKLVIIEEDSDSNPGTIIHQNIYDQYLSLDGAIEVIVSKGTLFRTENYIGRKQEEVQALLSDLGLNCVFNEVSGNGTQGTIVKQSIIEGTNIIIQKDYLIFDVIR
jgi:beta-lactam-binding protein with PASTA domain